MKKLVIALLFINAVYASQGELEKPLKELGAFQRSIPESTYLQALPKELWERLGAIANLDAIATTISDRLLKRKAEFGELQLSITPWVISPLIKSEIDSFRKEAPFLSNPSFVAILIKKIIEQLKTKGFFPERSSIEEVYIILSVLGLETPEAIAWLSEVIKDPTFLKKIGSLLTFTITHYGSGAAQWPGYYDKQGTQHHPSLEQMKQVINTFVRAGINLRNTIVLSYTPLNAPLAFLQYLFEQGAIPTSASLSSAQVRLTRAQQKQDPTAIKEAEEVLAFIQTKLKK
jgi:hypothetical protein